MESRNKTRESVETLDLSDSIEEMESTRITKKVDVSIEEIPSSPEVVPIEFLSDMEIDQMRAKLKQLEVTEKMVGLAKLPDGGAKIIGQMNHLRKQLAVVDKQRQQRPIDRPIQYPPAKAVAVAEKKLDETTGAIPKTQPLKPMPTKLSEEELRRKIHSTKVNFFKNCDAF